jgi:rubredoxin
MTTLRQHVATIWRRLLCAHVFWPATRFVGWELVPETPGFKAMKERRECALCGKVKVKTLWLMTISESAL